MAEQISFLTVRDAVIAELDAAFSDVPVYGDEIKQNLIAPSFFVRVLEPAHTQELGRRFRREHPLVVHFFPPDGDSPNEDMLDMADKLSGVLGKITVAGQPVFCHGMRFEIVDGVLLFFVSYTILVYASAPVDPDMQMLDHTGGLKHG